METAINFTDLRDQIVRSEEDETAQNVTNKLFYKLKALTIRFKRLISTKIL